MTRQYLFVGDTHGDLDFIENAARIAAANDAEIIQLGDFGFIWPKRTSLDALSIILERAGQYEAKPPVKLRWIDGNHDWHPYIRNKWGVTKATEVSPHVTYQPRGSTYTDEDGTTFLFCGGAPSIDKWVRTEGVSWWPEEVITKEEYERCMSHQKTIDVLVTHDAPDYPPGYGPKGTPEFRALSARSMQGIDDMIKWHRPKLHVHGHWHHRYSRDHDNGKTRIVGLDCNYARVNDAIWLWSNDE